ncbi:MFS transporter, DHA2 family, multidrug resistance protein [Kytococcus aerolatus]|uniref:MFS transporter, DHA2 family, multidrug resistance protein n=2 Tax=Kytococcus aerolatus TaxID=592308 RepID=A0A212U1N8_9MICO|nr:MFS transporter, DHA2 family, multidrug resistance protein [Kytococcus aerolatus]
MSTARRWAALAVLVLPVLLISIDMSVLSIAVPALAADLDPTANELLWIIDLYSFLLAGLLIAMGSLGDRIGRRRILLIGAPVFGVASLVCAFATTPTMLLAGRALLGIGGATLMPSTLGLIRTIFPDRDERRTAIAVWAMAFAGGAALGPLVGGLLLEHYWWGSVFLLNVPVILLFLVTAPLLLPEARDPHPGPLDLPSVALSILGMIGVVYALKVGVKGVDATVLLSCALGAAALAWFVVRQRRSADPMLDLSLFGNPAFSTALLVNVTAIFAFMGLMFFLPQYLMLVRGMGAAQAGLWMLPLAAASTLGTVLAPVVARWLSVRTVVLVGLALMSLGLATGTQLGDGLLVFVLLSACFGIGSGLAETLTNDVILAAAPSDRAGAAAAISETAYEVGGAMGTAVLGTVGLALYSTRVQQGAPAGLGEGATETAAQTLAAAHEVAAETPGAGPELVALADAAFLAGVHLVVLVGMTVGLGTLVLAWRGLRSEAGRASV